MIKELSVFFSDPLRRSISARAKSGGKCPAGVSAALDFLHDVLVESVSGVYSPFPPLFCNLPDEELDEELERLFGPLWKFFDPSHHEGVQVRDAFRNASKMKVYVGFLGGVYVDLIMRFYKGEEDLSFFTWKVVFTRRGGKLAYSTYGDGPLA